jgi:hypothetical protein
MTYYSFHIDAFGGIGKYAKIHNIQPRQFINILFYPYLKELSYKRFSIHHFDINHTAQKSMEYRLLRANYLAESPFL